MFLIKELIKFDVRHAFLLNHAIFMKKIFSKSMNSHAHRNKCKFGISSFSIQIVFVSIYVGHL